MMAMVQEGLIVALWLMLPLVAALWAAGLVATALGWWSGTTDASLASGLRWLFVVVAIVISAKLGGPRMVAYAQKAFATTELSVRQGR